MKKDNRVANEEELTKYYETYIDNQEKELQELLDKSGLNSYDPRFKSLRSFLEGKTKDKKEFLALFEEEGSNVLLKALRKKLVIPNFADFRKDIEEIFERTKSQTGGKMNDTLPHPEPDRQPAYAVSVCTIDGQILQLGDHDMSFLLQSVSKPINYAIAVKEAGREKVHKHVGVEPGNEQFESSTILNEKDLPHNPMITSGAMMTAALIKPDLDVDKRLDYVLEMWEAMMGSKNANYNNDSFEAEKKDSHKHYALGHLMKERDAFPEGADLEQTIDFYLKCCAIEVNIDALAHAAATMANYGRCPSTGKEVFDHDTVRDTLSLMLSSGMYDHSGEFAFRVGLPAKSGIAGGIMLVIPNLMGVSIYSPPLDEHGNSLRGVEFCEELVKKFNFHKYDAVGTPIHGKKDPRK